jgi:predicted cobalt transporter CbtA
MSENESKDDFAAQATSERTGLVGEFADFLKENKKWWLAPIVIAILGLGLLVLLGGTAAAPFIYTLF